MFLYFTNQSGEVLYSNFPEACEECLALQTKPIETVTCPATGGVWRRAGTKIEGGTVHFCGNEIELLKSRRIVRERLRLYSQMLSELEHFRKTLLDNVSSRMKRLMHNLISQNAHIMQEVYDVVPQEALSRTMFEQVGIVEKALKSDAQKAARAILKINKHNMAMKCEFTAFKLLSDVDHRRLNVRSHKVRKVVMNASHLFFQDFREKDVFVQADPYEGSVRMDYDSVQVALYHLIDNAVKYVLSDTELHISFPVIDGRQRIHFDMVSMIISDGDMDRLFEEGYSGELPRILKLAGSGLGLALARDLLRLNGAELQIKRNVDPARRRIATMGTYENNQIDIILGEPMR